MCIDINNNLYLYTDITIDEGCGLNVILINIIGN